jgi:hypothetical protein
MTLDELIAQARTALDTAISTRQREQDALMALRSEENLTEEAVAAQVTARDAADAEVTRRQAALDQLEAERRAGGAHLPARPGPARAALRTGRRRGVPGRLRGP